MVPLSIVYFMIVLNQSIQKREGKPKENSKPEAVEECRLLLLLRLRVLFCVVMEQPIMNDG